MKAIVIETPNGVVVTAIVVTVIGNTLVCYAQNRLFTVLEVEQEYMDFDPEFRRFEKCTAHDYFYQEIIVEYCVIPEYDSILNNIENED